MSAPSDENAANLSGTTLAADASFARVGRNGQESEPSRLEHHGREAAGFQSANGAGRTRTGDLLGAISGRTFAPDGARSLKLPVCRDSL
jgi:hypothetical protein